MNAADAETTTDDGSEHAGETSRYTTGAAHAAAWGVAFLILRLFAVSDYNWDTAFSVSTTLGFDDGLALLFGSLMAGHLLTEILLMCVLPLLFSAYLWGPRSHRPVVMLLATLGSVTLIALTASFQTWWLPVATLAVFGALALVRALPLQERLRRASSSLMARVGWVAGVAVLLIAALVQTPWVPHEQIETTDGTVNGYVLSVDSGYLNVLTDDHKFVILISGDVLSRT